MKLQDCPRLPKGDPSGRIYDYAKIKWPVSYDLLSPVKSDTRGEIKAVEIREPRVFDTRAIAKVPDRMDGSVKGLSMLCGVAPEDIDKMASRDFSVLSDFLVDFLG